MKFMKFMEKLFVHGSQFQFVDFRLLVVYKIDKESWENPIWGVNGDRVEVIRDEARDSNLTIHYFDSEDGVCRTAFANIDNQVHECRHHTNEVAWKFISKFTR